MASIGLGIQAQALEKCPTERMIVCLRAQGADGLNNAGVPHLTRDSGAGVFARVGTERAPCFFLFSLWANSRIWPAVSAL